MSVVWARGLAGLATAQLVVAALGAALAGLDPVRLRDSFVLTNAVIALSCAAAGYLLASQRPRNPVGWLLLAAGCLQGATAAAAPYLLLGLDRGWPDTAVRTLATVATWSWPASIGLCLPAALLLFPDGRLPGPRWRPLLPLVVLSGVLFVVYLGADPAGLTGDPRSAGWLVVPAYPQLAGLWAASEALNGLVYVAAAAGLVVRYRRGDEIRRRQLLWIVLALLVTLLMLAVWVAVPSSGPQVLILLVIPLVPVAITIAVLRHGLLDIRLVVARTVLYALLSAGVGAVYLGIVALGGDVLRQGTGAPVLAALVVALVFHPIRLRVQRVVDRAVYGDRGDPFVTMSRVGAGLSDGDVLGAVRGALRLPYAAVRVDGEVRDASGERPEQCETVALAHAGGPVGELVVGVRSGQGRLDAADRAALDLVAVPLAAAVHAAALSAALQRSRGAIVAAREEERRRLRRDLHDGLGPVLTGVAFTVDAVRNLLRDDPDRADVLLADLRARTGGAIDDIRRVVHALRPPSLDELGLVEALRRHGAQFAGPGPVVEVDAPPDLPSLPAAVEVAAFRIAVEALTNAVRHAAASHVDVTIRLDRAGGVLELLVTDDGPGSTSWTPGVGLRSIAERAAELGGRTEAGPVDGGGSVRAVLPMSPASTPPRAGRSVIGVVPIQVAP